MKTLFAVLLLASPLFAYEQPGNPDRYISIGVEGFKGQEAGVLRSGNTTAGTSGGKVEQSRKIQKSWNTPYLYDHNDKTFSCGCEGVDSSG